MKQCTSEANLSQCNCTFSCSKKGVCCECIASHRRAGQLPACYFPADAESTGNRSIENFIRIYQKQGGSYLR
jgi:hypothetical protein